MCELRERVRSFIEEQNMIQPGDRIVAGVSGGADSVCLLLLLRELTEDLQFSLYAVHVNHCLRGAESDGDEDYVRELCARLGVPLTVRQLDVAGRAVREGLSTEEAGRLCRYESFREEAERLGGAKIAVAHHANDQAETVLLHLFRGSGIRGLRGMEPVHEDIVRPLLTIRRSEIEQWLREQGIRWRFDSSNGSRDYTRNRIRLGLLEQAEQEINPQAVMHICESARELEAIEQYLEGETRKAYRLCVREDKDSLLIFAQALRLQEPLLQDRLLRLCMARTGGLKDVERKHIHLLRELFELQTGRQLSLPAGRRARREYEGVRLWAARVEMPWRETPQREKSWREASQLELSEEFSVLQETAQNIWSKSETEKTTTAISENEQKVMVLSQAEKAVSAAKIAQNEEIQIPVPGNLCLTGQSWTFDLIPAEKKQRIPEKRYTKWFDYDRIKRSAVIRRRRPGDYLEINAAHERKTLKRYFTDEKIPAARRGELELLADGSHIIWIPGYRISEGYKVTEETKTILRVHIDGGYEDE